MYLKLLLIGIFLAVLYSFLSLPFVQKSLNLTYNLSKKEVLKLNFPLLHTSDFQSFAISKETSRTSYGLYKLTLLPINGESPIITDNETAGMGGALYLGDVSPQSSPDLKKAAYISKDNQLKIISADGKSEIELPDNLLVSYISGWSPDSKKLIVYSQESSYIGGEGAATTPTPRPATKYLPSGFYLLDLEKGEGKLLAELKGVDKWINNEKVLTVTSGEKDQFAIFNIKTGHLDTSTLKGLFDQYFGVQTNFNHDGKLWALTLGNTGNDPSKPSSSLIVLAQFPKIEGITIDSGRWADVQMPKLSPNADNLIYIRAERNSGEDEQDAIYLNQNSINTRLTKGYPLMWTDNNNFIYSYNPNYPQLQQYYIFDISTKSSRRLI